MGRRHFKALALEELLERRRDHLLVVHDQDPAPRSHVTRQASSHRRPVPAAPDFMTAPLPAWPRRQSGVGSAAVVARAARCPFENPNSWSATGCGSVDRFERKPNKESRSMARLRPKGKRAGIFFQDLPADEEAQTGAVRLGREERLEEPASVGDRDAAAVIVDGQHKPAVFGPGGHVISSLVVGRVDRVQDEVQNRPESGGRARPRPSAGRGETSVVIVRCLVRW